MSYDEQRISDLIDGGLEQKKMQDRIKMTHTTHTQSTRLKALGFDKPVENCIYTGDTGNNVDRYFNSERAINYNANSLCISLPTPSEVLDWFRETKGIDAWVAVKLNDDLGNKRYVYYIFQSKYYGQSAGTYPTHLMAESALIDKLIEIEEQKA